MFSGKLKIILKNGGINKVKAVDSMSERKGAVEPAPERIPTSGAKARIMIVDDFPVIRDGLAQIIDQQPEMCCVARTGSAEETLKCLKKSEVDLAIVDISLGSSSGLDLMRMLKELYPKMRLLALSMHNESFYAEYALINGSRGYVMKEEVTDSIVQAIQCVLRGGVHLSSRMAKRILNRLRKPGHNGTEDLLDNLSKTQRTIFEMLGRNHSRENIAGELALTPEQLDNEFGEIRSRLNLDSQFYLEALAALVLQSINGG